MTQEQFDKLRNDMLFYFVLTITLITLGFIGTDANNDELKTLIEQSKLK